MNLTWRNTCVGLNMVAFPFISSHLSRNNWWIILEAHYVFHLIVMLIRPSVNQFIMKYSVKCSTEIKLYYISNIPIIYQRKLFFTHPCWSNSLYIVSKVLPDGLWFALESSQLSGSVIFWVFFLFWKGLCFPLILYPLFFTISQKTTHAKFT